MRYLLLIILLLGSQTFHFITANKIRAALIVTLTGNNTLSDYFEWSCRTIGASKRLIDMLVFHESNVKVRNLRCASNVKLIDLGDNGLAKVIVAKRNDLQHTVRTQMQQNLITVLKVVPQVLVEVKPMLGTILEEYLRDYTHWSYTDPDIIWGNIVDWIEVKDLERFDYVTIAKTGDAGRLFLCGQVCKYVPLLPLAISPFPCCIFVPFSYESSIKLPDLLKYPAQLNI